MIYGIKRLKERLEIEKKMKKFHLKIILNIDFVMKIQVWIQLEKIKRKLKIFFYLKKRKEILEGKFIEKNKKKKYLIF